MNSLNFRIYVSVEIKQKVLLFSVLKTIRGKTMILFKRELENAKNWLNDNDEVINPSLVAQHLKSFITEYEQTHNGFKIMDVSLILPANHLKISERYQEVSLLSDNNHEFSLASRTTISELKKVLRHKPWTFDYSIVDAKPLLWTLDDSPMELSLISKTKAKKLGVRALVYELPLGVVQTHTQVVAMVGCNLLLTTLNITELYHLVAKAKTNYSPTIITNWNEENLEVGYFENGILKRFQIFQSGINSVVDNFAKKLNLKLEVAKDYVFKLIDFSSSNNVTTNIFQKWDTNQKLLKKYTTLEISEFLTFEIKRCYSQVKNFIKTFGMLNKTINYNFGLIQKIPGVEILLRFHNNFANDYVYNNFVFGMGLTTNFNTAVGAVQLLERINANPDNPWVRTSIGSFQKQPQSPTTTNSRLNNFPQSPKPLERALFLKHKGIIVDYQEVVQEPIKK